MLLVNSQNQAEQKCRVVRVDDTASEYFSVAFEFDAPNSKFWPVVFPPGDWKAPPVDSQRIAGSAGIVSLRDRTHFQDHSFHRNSSSHAVFNA